MKKAKQYYAELKPVLESGDDEEIKKAVVRVVKEFIIEIADTLQARNAKLNSALVAIIEEQNRKWNSLCDKLEKDNLNYLNRDVPRKWAKEEGYL